MNNENQAVIENKVVAKVVDILNDLLWSSCNISIILSILIS